MNDIFDALLQATPMLFTFVAFIAFCVWFFIDIILIRRFEGKIKRGVKVWSKELSNESWQYLLNLKADVLVHRKILFSSYKSAFIRVQNSEVLIYCTPRTVRSSWPYVGYVDLTLPAHELEYRTSLPGIIFLIPFTIIGVLIFVINFIFQTRAIDGFIEVKTKENAVNH